MAYQTHGEKAEQQEALRTRFHDGEFSETVYRASLYALGWRGADLDHIMKQELEIQYERQKARRGTRL